MTLEQLRAAYPGCPDAVEMHEQMGGEHVFAVARQRGIPPDQAVFLMQLKLSLYLKTVPHFRQVHEQMGHPDFLKYVAGKLGAM